MSDDQQPQEPVAGDAPEQSPSVENTSPPPPPPEDDWAAALAEQAQAAEEEKNASKQASSGEADTGWDEALAAQHAQVAADKPHTKRAEFQEFPLPTEQYAPRAITELDVILDIPVKIAMEVGSTHITIRNLLKLNQGSVIELDRLAGEPLDVLVNGTLIAHGEVVVINEKFGIRLTDVMSAAERIQKIQ